MGINFPNFPSIGDLHPTPPQAGVPQYRWDGVAWVAQSQDQLAFVKRTGDTMSGALTLPADPAAALQAATKQYVDAKSSLYISDNPPVSPPDGSMWWDSDNGLLYIRYNDGAGPSQWVQAVATPAIDASVFVNKAGDTMGGALTLPGDPAAALQAAPKQYVDAVRAYAAPYDAMAYSGMQINGGMEVSQERGNTAFTFSTQVYVNDGWLVSSTGAQQVGCYPQGNGAAFSGFINHLYVYTNVANAAPVTTNSVFLSQSIEGYRVARLGWGTANASPITVCFWVQAIRAGLASGSIRNALANRSYPFSFTINAANTWEYKTVTIPGDTTGTWEKTTGVGISLTFAVMSGPTLLTTAGAWTAGNFIGVAGTSNFCSAVSDGYRVTGVVVLPGTQAPTAAQSPTIMRSYDQELMTCMRYFEKTTVPIIGTTVPTSGYSYVTWFYKAMKRSTPTTIGGPGTLFTQQYNGLDQLIGYTTNAAANPQLGTGTTSDARL